MDVGAPANPLAIAALAQLKASGNDGNDTVMQEIVDTIATASSVKRET